MRKQLLEMLRALGCLLALPAAFRAPEEAHLSGVRARLSAPLTSKAVAELVATTEIPQVRSGVEQAGLGPREVVGCEFSASFPRSH